MREVHHRPMARGIRNQNLRNADAQNFIVSMQHQEKSGYGVSAVAKGVDGDELETAEVLKKKKNWRPKRSEGRKSPKGYKWLQKRLQKRLKFLKLVYRELNCINHRWYT